MKHHVVNIVNFVRGVEPRSPALDMTETIRREIELNNRFGFPNTVLLQYDALNQSSFREILAQCDPEKTEFGLWFEFCEDLIRACGIEWRGRPGYSWDYHVNPGFSFAYTCEEKKAITDECMRLFRDFFGCYPKSVGSWLLDSDTVSYMQKKYGVEAFCICREQWGTDGYSLWGGYYNGPYYPSKNNLFTPAQTKEEQIPAPVFRMLGADPIYCYYEHYRAKYNGIDQGLFTLEPTWKCGQSEKWVDWYFDMLTGGECLSFAYTQTGQENNFPWKTMTESLPMQYEKISRLVESGRITLETMAASGRRFRASYSETPAASLCALSDWADLGHQSVWYSCKNYRLNLFRDKDEVFIRDLHKFDETVRDPYLDAPVTGHTALCDNLPVVDGLRFSSEDVKAGLSFGRGTITCAKELDGALEVVLDRSGETLTVLLTPDSILMTADTEFSLPFRYAKENAYGLTAVTGSDEKSVFCEHNGRRYALTAVSGSFRDGCFRSEKGRLTLKLS